MKNQYRVNEQIRVREVRVVSEDGAEVMPTRKALDLARQQGVDLVEISPNAQPPVCRLIDYSKFLYQQKKRQKELKHAKEFLEEGNKVRAYVFFKGRSILFKEQGEVLLLRFAADLEDFGKVEQLPRLEGKKMFLFIAPKKAGVAKQSQQKRDKLAAEAARKQADKEMQQEEAPRDGGLFANAINGADALKKLTEE